MAKIPDRATAMGYELCTFDDDMGQSMLVQQKQNAIWQEEQEEQQLFNTTEETVNGGESVEESGINGATGWRC